MQAVAYTYRENVLTSAKSEKNARRGYRFLYNGMEKDDEVYGDYNSYDFGARLYNPRLGRWLAVDPLAVKYPDLSPYSYTANSPIIFYDPDGQKFVNPYKERYDKASLDLSNKQKIYEESMQNWQKANPNSKLTSKMKKGLREQSGLVAAQTEFDAAKMPYEKVEFFFNTVQASNKEEYDYFNTLTDAYGNEIEIVPIFYGVNREGTAVGETDGLQTIQVDEMNYRVNLMARDNRITIKLYKTNYVIEQQQNSSNSEISNAANMNTNSGHTYRTFANELGDIKFWFTKINNHDDLTKYYQGNASGTPNYTSDDQSYAGPYSREYEKSRVKDAKEKGIDVNSN